MANIFQKPLFKNTFIYTLTSGFSKGISFLVLPLLSKYLVPQELGMAANFDVIASILALLSGQVIVNGLPYFYYGKSKKEIATLVSSLIFLIITLELILSVALLFCEDTIDSYLNLCASFQGLALLFVISELLSGINLILLRLENKPFMFSVLNISQTLIYIAFLINLVVVWNLKGAGKIYSVVAVQGVMACIHLAMLIKRGYITVNIRKQELKELIRFGLPLLPHSLSFWIKGGLDKILLTTYCGLAVNGLYSMAMSFGALYSIFLTAFNNAFVPYLQKRISLITSETEKKEKVNLVRMSYKLFTCFIILYFIIVPICWLIINYVIDDQYISSFQFIPWIILALTINSFYSLVIQYPYTVKKTLGLGVITFSGSLVQCLLTFLLVRNIGMDGIKYSLVIGALVIAVGVWWYSNKVYPMPWFSSKLLYDRKLQ